MSMLDNRLVSLDAFRGITIAGMILVNNPGSWQYVYGPLRHAQWHGWTPTDFIFPFFLFIMGVAMSFSFGTRIERGDSHKKLFLKILRRTLIILVLGFSLNLYWRFDFTTVRIPGVLQRIALCYFFASAIMLMFSLRWQIGLSAFFLIAYWAALKLIPVPGHGTGVLEPAANLCWYIDSHLLEGHTWSGAPAQGFDPEGILSTIPAIVTTLLGVFTGNWLRSEKLPYEKAAGLFFAGNIGLVFGVIFNELLPINKNLWTSSYVIFMAGMALQFLGFCYWLIDIKGLKKWAYPFVVYGTNAIVAYLTLSLFAKTLYLWTITQADGKSTSLKSIIYDHLFDSWAGNFTASLLYPISMLLIWFVLLSIMYRKKIFIKI